MNASAIPEVGDCGCFSSAREFSEFFVFSDLSQSGVAPFEEAAWNVLNVCVKLDKSFKKRSICSEFFN